MQRAMNPQDPDAVEYIRQMQKEKEPQAEQLRLVLRGRLSVRELRFQSGSEIILQTRQFGWDRLTSLSAGLTPSTLRIRLIMELSDVRKVASLARLALDDEELQASGRQLTSILEYVQLLDEVDIAGVAPMTHPVPAENVFRDDQVLPSLPREAALSNAPKTDGEFFVVPKILEEKGA